MDSGFRVLDSGLIQWNLDSRFHSLVGFRIPWAVFWIPRAKFSRIPDSTRRNFLRFRNPDSLTWVETVADPGKRLGGPGSPPPLISIISSPNWGPKSRKKVFLRPPLAPTPPAALYRKAKGLDPPLTTHGRLTFFSFPCLSKTGGTSGSCGCSSSSWPKNHKSTYTGI